MRRLKLIARGLCFLVFTLTSAATLTVSDAAAQCGQDYHGAPKISAVPGGAPLAIGDSVLADAVPELVAYGFEADGMVCRQMSQGIAMLRERRDHLPHLVVLALGANGEVTPTEIDEALELLGGERVLVLVTPHGGVSPSAPAVIRAATAANPGRIVLLDWDRLAAQHKDWLAPDGVHLGGTAGIDGFAAMIAGALTYADAPATEAEGENVDPGTPETLPSPPVHHHAHKHAKTAPVAKPSRTGTTAAPLATSARKADPGRARNTAGRVPTGALGGGIAALAALGTLAVMARRRRRRIPR